jgi:hypothetical protein
MCQRIGRRKKEEGRREEEEGRRKKGGGTRKKCRPAKSAGRTKPDPGLNQGPV